ncbi:MAG: hypothetical protein ACRDN0_04960 [Trebonia sp.]
MANVWTALANFVPFCSRASRALAGVDELKNFSQLAVIAEAADPELDAGAELEAGVAGAELAGGELVVEVEPGLELPLEQAVIEATRTKPNIGAR